MAIELTESDYELPSDQTSVWIGVEGLSCYIHKTDEGVVVDIFRAGCEADDAIASTYAFWAEAAEDTG